MISNVVIVGLGLMGGSMAKAVRAYTDCRVYGWNRTRAVAEDAVRTGTLDGVADDETLSQADLVVIGLYPKSTVEWIEAHIGLLKPGCMLVDMVGVKQYLVDAVTPLAQAHGQAAVKGILAKAAADGAELPRQEGVPLHLVAEAFFNDEYVQKVAHIGELCVIELYCFLHSSAFHPTALQ